MTTGRPVFFSEMKKRIGKTEVLILSLCAFLLLGALYMFKAAHSAKSVALLAIGIVLLIAMWLIYRNGGSNEDTLERRVFPLTLLTLGLISCFFFPAGTVPDEIYHFCRSYAYSTAIIAGDPQEVRMEDAPFFNGGFMSKEINRTDWDYVKEHLFDSAEYGSVSLSSVSIQSSDYGSEYMSKADLITEMPQLKLPSALGILLAQALGMNHVVLFYMGRLFNMLYAAVLIILAIRLIPLGKKVLMVVSLTPMTLHLIGSYSYDAGTIGLSFLLTALVVRAISGSGRYSATEAVASVAVVGLLAPCKVIYSVIALGFFLVPRNRFKSRKTELAFKGGILAVMMASIFIIRMASLVGIASADEGSLLIRGEETGQPYSLGLILSNPIESAIFFARSIETLGSLWLFNMVGDSLGWFQGSTSFPDYVPVIFLALLALSMLKSKDDSDAASLATRLSFLAICSVGAFGAILSMWTGWTLASDTTIQGVQGRYFIPLLPMALIALRPNSIQVNVNTGFALVSLTSILTISGFAYIAYSTCLF